MLDLLVVGGGPAGAATAIHAALAGMTVRVWEPRSVPIDKACGEGLMPSGVRMLREDLGVGVSGTPFHGIRYRNEHTAATARFASGPGLGIRRTELSDRLHARLAELGVPVVAARAEPLVVHADRVEVDGMSARWLAAADGLHSPIRRQLGLGGPPPKRPPRRFGLRRHVAVPAWTDLVEVHWAERSEAYVTPVPGGVGIAILTSDQGSFDRQLDRFGWLRQRVAGRHGFSPVRGAGPFLQRVRRRTYGPVLLVGDAAGYLDALTGEGLSIAFASARELVRCLITGQDYDRAWLRATRGYRWLTGALVGARARPTIAGRIVPTAAQFPAVFTRAVRILADQATTLDT